MPVVVYARYTNEDLTVNTQAGFGNVKAKVNNNFLNFGNGGSFGKPSAKDIFGCSTGPFATGSNQETNVIIPRLAAAFNRSTLLLGNNQPNSVHPKQFYQDAVTNVSSLNIALCCLLTSDSTTRDLCMKLRLTDMATLSRMMMCRLMVECRKRVRSTVAHRCC